MKLPQKILSMPTGVEFVIERNDDGTFHIGFRDDGVWCGSIDGATAQHLGEAVDWIAENGTRSNEEMQNLYGGSDR